jgi:phage terminase large subunit-like protein
VWLLLAGRGFGKTRAGAEFVRATVTAGLARHVALVAPTALDARAVMVEGESGLLSIGPPGERPDYEPSLHRLTWPNGAVATVFSADEPNRLRGPQHDLAWCDELAAWRYPAAWDMLMFGLRLGQDPRAIVTTTPRPIKLIRELLADPKVVVTRGRTEDNRKTTGSIWRPLSWSRSCGAIRARGLAGRSSTARSSTTCRARCGRTASSTPRA